MDSVKLEEVGYNIIIGRDLQQALNVVIYFDYSFIKWDDVSITMDRTKLYKSKIKELHTVFQLTEEPKTVHQATERVSCMLDVSYEKANSNYIVKNIVVNYQGTDIKKS